MQVRIMQRQQETMIQCTTNFPGKAFEHGKIKDQFILIERAFRLYQHTIIMTMQPFTLTTEGDKVGRAKA